MDLYYDDTEEIGHVREGEEQFSYFSVQGVKCAVVICADFGIRSLNAVFERDGVELLLLPTGAGGKREERLSNADLKTEQGLERYYTIMKDACFPGKGMIDCIRCRRAMAAVNICGWDGKSLYHGGQGSIINSFGDAVALIAGIPNIDRQRPRFAWGAIDFDERL